MLSSALHKLEEGEQSVLESGVTHVIKVLVYLRFAVTCRQVNIHICIEI